MQAAAIGSQPAAIGSQPAAQPAAPPAPSVQPHKTRLDVLHKRVGAVAEQQLHERVVLVAHRLVQRGAAVGLGIDVVHVCAKLEELRSRGGGRMEGGRREGERGGGDGEDKQAARAPQRRPLLLPLNSSTEPSPAAAATAIDGAPA